MSIKKLALYFIYTLVCSLIAEATSPGKRMSVLASGDESVDLFVTAFYLYEGVAGIELSYIPPKIREACANRDVKYCRELSHCLDYPDQTQCSVYDQKLIHEAKPPNRQHREHFLARVFQQMIYSKNARPDDVEKINKILNFYNHVQLELMAKSFGLSHSPKDSGNQSVSLNTSRSIPAKIHWDVWPNGTNINILHLGR